MARQGGQKELFRVPLLVTTLQISPGGIRNREQIPPSLFRFFRRPMISAVSFRIVRQYPNRRDRVASAVPVTSNRKRMPRQRVFGARFPFRNGVVPIFLEFNPHDRTTGLR